MIIDYFVTGGCIMIHKNDFSKEILRRDSILRTLLGYNSSTNTADKTEVIKRDDNGYVTIDFHLIPETKLSEDPRLLLVTLKQRYGNAITGKLFYRALYTTFNQVFYFKVDMSELT